MGTASIKQVPLCKEGTTENCKAISVKRGADKALQSWKLVPQKELLWNPVQNPNADEFENKILPSLSQYKNICRSTVKDRSGNAGLFVCKGKKEKERRAIALLPVPAAPVPAAPMAPAVPVDPLPLAPEPPAPAIPPPVPVVLWTQQRSAGQTENRSAKILGIGIGVAIATVVSTVLYSIRRIRRDLRDYRQSLEDLEREIRQMKDRLRQEQGQALQDLEDRLNQQHDQALQDVRQNFAREIARLGQRLRRQTMRLGRALGTVAGGLKKEQRRLGEEITRLAGAQDVRQMLAASADLERHLTELDGLIGRTDPQSLLRLAIARSLSSSNVPPEIRRWIGELSGTIRQEVDRAIARIWENNEGLRRLFPFQDGKPNATFIEIAVAIIKEEAQTLNRLTQNNPKLAELVTDAWNGEQIIRGRSAPLQLEALTRQPAMVEVAEIAGQMERFDLGTADTLRIPQEAIDQALQGGTIANGVDVLLEPGKVAGQLVRSWTSTLSPQQTTILIQYAKGIAEIWNRNEGVRKLFPIQNQKLDPQFIKIAIALLQGNDRELSAIAQNNTPLEEAIGLAKTRVNDLMVPQPQPVGLPRRAVELRRLQYASRLRLRNLRVRNREVFSPEVSNGIKNLATTTVPFVLLDVAEHEKMITPGQKSFALLSWLGGLTYYNRYTPAHVTLLAPFFGTGQAITEAGLRSVGVRPGSLGYKVGGTLGGFAGAEAMVIWSGKAAGAKTLAEAHALGGQVIHDASVHAAKSAANILSKSWTVLRTGATAVFNFAARFSANACSLPLLLITPEMLKGQTSKENV